MTFSIREGDPLAMPNYTLYVEPLLVRLKKLLPGAQVGLGRLGPEPYADDIPGIIESESELKDAGKYPRRV